jgi:hypothetical protein
MEDGRARSWRAKVHIFSYVYIVRGCAACAHSPLLMGEVSKFARGDQAKVLAGREFCEIDSVK